MYREYDKAVGKMLRELLNERKPNWTSDRLAREITIQCLKNLPYADRKNCPLPIDLKQNININTITNDELLNYCENKHNRSNSIIISKYKNNTDNEFGLDYVVTKNSIDSYLIGRTRMPAEEINAVCQIFEISFDSFMTNIYDRFNMDWNSTSLDDLTIEQAYNVFFKKVFDDREDGRYVYNTVTQRHFLSSLFADGKSELMLHFAYLPTKLGLKDLTDKNKKEVVYQRGKLMFVMKDGMCHVTSKLKVGSQGIPTKYMGFLIIMNPNSTGPTCTCFLREIDSTIGVFIIFSFRLPPLEKTQKIKIRISECISVRKSDGTIFVYRLILSENFINDTEMKYFVGHLKLGTSENTIDGRELNFLIKEKYIAIAKKYFNGSASDGTEYENAVYADLMDHFGEANKECYADIIRKLDESSNQYIENIRTINPVLLNSHDEHKLLFLSWIGKHGLSARYDKVEDLIDNEAEKIHKYLYPELHADNVEERGYLYY